MRVDVVLLASALCFSLATAASIERGGGSRSSVLLIRGDGLPLRTFTPRPSRVTRKPAVGSQGRALDKGTIMEDRVTGVRYSADTLKQGKPARRDRVNPQPTPGVYPQRASTQSVVIMYLHGSPRYKLVDDDIVQDEDDGAPGALPGVLPHDDEVVYRGGLKALREGAASSFSVEARSFECGKLNLSPKGNFALVSRELLGEKTNPNGPHKPHFENCGRRVYAWWENAHTSAWIIGSAENSEDTQLYLSEHTWEDLGVTKTYLADGPVHLRWVIE